MPTRESFVSAVAGISAGERMAPPGLPDTGPQSVTWIDFQNGRRAWLDIADPGGHRKLIETLLPARVPLYVQLDADTNEVERVIVPLVVKVESLTTLRNGDVAVELRPSHAPHVVRAANPDAKALVAALDDARRNDVRVAVVEDRKTKDIRDVRPFRATDEPGDDLPFDVAALAGEPSPLDAATPAFRALTVRLTQVTTATAGAIFGALADAGCDPANVRVPCIPFAYPTDGCHARAHRMCAIMHDEFNVISGKIWLYGRPHEAYTVETPNDPDCEVDWLYHVAPIVQTGTTEASLRVLDPALFEEPVTPADWIDVQFAQGTVVLTNRHLFDRLRPNGTPEFDPDMSKTREVLWIHRGQLIEQIRDDGHPPYCS